MTTLKMTLLGGIDVSQGQTAVTNFGARKATALLCYLIIGKQSYSRSSLAGLLWGEMPEPNARMNLRRTLSRLRPVIGDHLTITTQEVAFNRDVPYWLDVENFETAVSIPTSHTNIAPLREAIHLYKGDFLAGFYVRQAPVFEEWVMAQRVRLRDLAVQTLHTLVADCTHKGNVSEGIVFANRLLALDSWREAAHRQLMELLALSGQRSAALMQYDKCHRILSEELGVLPSPATTTLYEQILNNEFDAAALLSASGAIVLDNATAAQDTAVASHAATLDEAVQIPHNLQLPLTPFVGRTEELDALNQLLIDPTARLVTVLGGGGVGKTRFVLAVAEQLIAQSERARPFLDGVYFVSLARLSSPDEMPAEIATCTKFNFYEQSDLKQQLLNYLHDKKMLLILDNFEHLLDGVALAEEILREAPNLKILVTSREKLNRQWEYLFHLSGLSFPAGQTVEKMKGTTQYSAVQLFLDRARRARPDYKLVESDLNHVARVCTIVEGLPLGIIMAAAWMEILPLREVADEIQRGLDFLAVEMGDIPRRQRSLRATFAYSWRLMKPAEQTVFRQLAVFQGDFSREAAQVVTGATLHELKALVGKSLLQSELNGRFQIHELLRQFAAEKLALLPEMETAVRNRHAAYYCEYFRQLAEDLQGSRQLEAAHEIEVDFANGRIAWNWAVSHQQLSQVQKIILLWDNFLTSWRGRYQEAAILYGDLVETLTNNEKSLLAQQLLVQGLLCLARARAHAGERDQASQLSVQAEALFKRASMRDIEAWPGKPFVLRQLYWYVLPWDQQRKYLLQGLAAARRMGDRWQEIISLLALSERVNDLGNYHEAQKLLEEALAISTLQGDEMSQANVLQDLSRTAWVQEHYEDAAQFAKDSLVLNTKLENQDGVSQNLTYIGYAYMYLGQYDLAIRAFQDNLQLCQTYGKRVAMIVGYYRLSHVYMHPGQYQQAKAMVESCLNLGRGENFQLVCAYALTIKGNCAVVEGNLTVAKRCFSQIESTMCTTATKIALQGYLGWYSIILVYCQELEAARQRIIEALTANADVNHINIIAAMSFLCWAEKKWERAVELYALACQNTFVGKSQWYADVVGKKISLAAAMLSPEVAQAAKSRGKAMDLQKTYLALFAELTAKT